jgi:hypothetical protein
MRTGQPGAQFTANLVESSPSAPFPAELPADIERGTTFAWPADCFWPFDNGSESADDGNLA